MSFSTFIRMQGGEWMKTKGNPPHRTHPQIQAFIEKREGLRNPLFVLEVKWKRYDEVFLGHTENISLGGLFMSTNHTAHVGEKFPMEFILPDRKTKVDCTGEVVWTRQYSSEGAGSEGVGVRFVNLNAKKIKAIEQWILKQGNRTKKKS
jgi:uncharacterized protein (TIGR02266 family)